MRGAGMSESDSFINEVSEEVRRDRLFLLLRRYGWIAILIVVLLVGGAAWTEYSRARDRAGAEEAGDVLLSALSNSDPEERAAALDGVSLTGGAAAVSLLITAAAQEETGDLAAAIASLDNLATNTDVPEIYRDLASFKAAMLDAGTDPEARRKRLDSLANPGQPFALLAQEQLALADLSAGERDAAIARLTAIVQDAGAGQGLRDRVQTLMVSLGAPLPDDVTPDVTSTNP
jgi:hypothetical protein